MLIVSVLLILLLMYSVLGNNKRVKNVKFLDGYYNHRGYFDNKAIPENSISAFKKSIDYNFGIELDIQLTKDNKIIVFHDDDLQRMCGDIRKINELTYEELLEFNLLSSQEKIPLLGDVLNLVNGSVPIYIEIKDFSFNYHQLVDLTTKLLEDYRGNFVICSFNPLVLNYLKKIKPDYLRGIVSQNYSNDKHVPLYQRVILQNMFMNFIIKPDIISYGYSDINWSLKLN